MNRRWELLPPRPMLGPLKSPDSADTSVALLADGRVDCRISHAPIRRVTPQMITWWFHSIAGEMTIDGATYPRYLLWHPLDHIHWSLASPAPDGGVGVGARFHVVEAFGRNPEYLLDTVADVEQLDETGVVLTESKLGQEIVRLHHTWRPHPDGTKYDSHLIIGMESSLGQLFNRFARSRMFPEEMMWAWVKHNIEEVGNFEKFLPELYAAAGANAQTVRH